MTLKRKEQFKGPRVIACVLIEKKGKYLFTRQAPDSPRGAGRWFFPGGHIKPGEALEKAVKREASEEIGVEVEFEKLVGYLEYVKAPYHYIGLLCRCKIVKGEITPGGDVDKAKWVSREDFRKLSTRYVTRVVIDGEEIEELVSVLNSK